MFGLSYIFFTACRRARAGYKLSRSLMGREGSTAGGGGGDDRCIHSCGVLECYIEIADVRVRLREWSGWDVSGVP